jgi:hypothetical protein
MSKKKRSSGAPGENAGRISRADGPRLRAEARLKELLARQAELNAVLDLDKNERQIAPEDSEAIKRQAPATFVNRIASEKASEMAL